MLLLYIKCRPMWAVYWLIMERWDYFHSLNPTTKVLLSKDLTIQNQVNPSGYASWIAGTAHLVVSDLGPTTQEPIHIHRPYKNRYLHPDLPAPKDLLRGTETQVELQIVLDMLWFVYSIPEVSQNPNVDCPSSVP